MRRLALSIAAGSCFAFATPAAAQEATRSVDDYLCALAGKCAEGTEPAAAADDSKEAPDTKGFSLVRRSSGGSAAASSPTTGRPAATAPSRQGTRPAQAGTRSTRMGSSTSARRPVRSTAAAQGPVRRIDLRLSFTLGSAELTPQAREEAKVFARSLQTPELSGKRFLIEGHTDSSGTRATNLFLSQRRAAAVADFLANQGVSRDRFEVRGFGPDRPLPNRSASDPANRRVEAQLL